MGSRAGHTGHAGHDTVSLLFYFLSDYQISSQTFSNFFEYTKTMQENSNLDNKLKYIVDHTSRVTRSTWVLFLVLRTNTYVIEFVDSANRYEY